MEPKERATNLLVAAAMMLHAQDLLRRVEGLEGTVASLSILMMVTTRKVGETGLPLDELQALAEQHVLKAKAMADMKDGIHDHRN